MFLLKTDCLVFAVSMVRTSYRQRVITEAYQDLEDILEYEANQSTDEEVANDDDSVDPLAAARDIDRLSDLSGLTDVSSLSSLSSMSSISNISSDSSQNRSNDTNYVIDEISHDEQEQEEAEEASTSLSRVAIEYIQGLESTSRLQDSVPYPKGRRLIDEIELYEEQGQESRFRALVRMKPAGFNELARLVQATSTFVDVPLSNIRERLAVVLYRLGRSGNGVGERDVAQRCGTSTGSVVRWTQELIKGLAELREAVVTWASEEERQNAQEWVYRKSGVRAWRKGWCLMDGTHINFAWTPALNPTRYFNYKRSYSINVCLIVLPHSLRVMEAVVGFAGSAHDSRVFKSSCRIASNPRLFLDEGEFIWTDKGYGYSPFSCQPYTPSRANTSRDMHKFNYAHSRVRVRAEHAIAYLKQRFQSLMAYRGNLYREKDFETLNLHVMACIVAHTVGSRYDQAHDIGAYLRESNLSSSLVNDLVRDLERVPHEVLEEAESQRQERIDADKLFQRTQSRIIREQGPGAVDRLFKVAGKQLREKLHKALFRSNDWEFVDTNADSRLREMTADNLHAEQNHLRQRRRERRQERRSRSTNVTPSRRSGTSLLTPSRDSILSDPSLSFASSQ